MNSEFQRYITQRIDALSDFTLDDSMSHCLLSIEKVLYSRLIEDGSVFTIGNGGSCAQAQHFAAELVGRFGTFRRGALPAIALTSDSTVLTALSNDFGFEHCFSRQIEGLFSTKDILVVFTTSGKSRNIIEAIQSAKNQGGITIAFCGERGSHLVELVDYCAIVPTSDTAIIQECHLTFSHYLCERISRRFSNLSESFWNNIIVNIPNEAEFLILDRDGVINEKIPNGYAKSPHEINFTLGFLDIVEKLAQRFKRIFIVTNQKGVGLGIMSLEELQEVNDYILNQIVSHGGKIDNIYYSTDVDDSAFDRKPNVGMARQLIDEYPDVEFRKTVVIGDSASDQLFANNIGALFLKFGNVQW